MERDTVCMRMSVVNGLAVLLFVLCSCASGSSESSEPGTPIQSAAHVSAAATATPAAHAAALTGATLGGLRNAFVGKYGAAADQDLWDVNNLTFGLNFTPGTDGQPHVSDIMAYKTDATTWTQAEVQPICTAFIPSDGIRQPDGKDSDGNLIQVYLSPGLAATFPAQMFLKSPRGTASITYIVKNGGVFQCNITTGA